MNSHYFEFPYTNFEQVYVIIDDLRQIVHISTVTYKFSITFSLKLPLEKQLEQFISFGDVLFNQDLKKVVTAIFNELELI